MLRKKTNKNIILEYNNEFKRIKIFLNKDKHVMFAALAWLSIIC